MWEKVNGGEWEMLVCPPPAWAETQAGGSGEGGWGQGEGEEGGSKVERKREVEERKKLSWEFSAEGGTGTGALPVGAGEDGKRPVQHLLTVRTAGPEGRCQT